MEAARNNHLGIVAALMNHQGIDLNVQDCTNVTALHWAVSENHLAIVAQLLNDDRMDCSLKDSGNWTPLKLAIICEHHECVKILREHGAQDEDIQYYNYVYNI